MQNPNEYDDDAYNRGRDQMEQAIGDLWDAGAEEDDIRDIVKDELQNIGEE